MAQKLTYTQCGDYYIPDIRLEHTGIQTLGKYGRMYCVREHQTITECLIFQNSFKLGARMMLEVMEE